MSNRNLIKLRVMGISYSQIQTGAYALILAQVGGSYRIPVVIGPAEAQSIALRMEGITPPRPMTHDLFVSFAHAFGVKLEKVFIYQFQDGIFSSELTFSDEHQTITIDSRTSDAIAIAMRTGSPIYTTPEILDETGFIIEDEQSDDAELSHDDDNDSDNDDGIEEIKPYGNDPRPENFTIEQLEQTLQELIEEEDYEQAARISEILNKKRNK